MSKESKDPKNTKNQILQENDPAGSKVLAIMSFFVSFFATTICRRLVAMLFILANVPVQRICILTGLHEDIVYTLRQKLQNILTSENKFSALGRSRFRAEGREALAALPRLSISL